MMIHGTKSATLCRTAKSDGSGFNVRLIIVLAMIVLTALDGSPVWVESTAVIIMRPSKKECKEGNGAAIRVGSIGLCVQESPEQIKEMIRSGNKNGSQK